MKPRAISGRINFGAASGTGYSLSAGILTCGFLRHPGPTALHLGRLSQTGTPLATSVRFRTEWGFISGFQAAGRPRLWGAICLTDAHRECPLWVRSSHVRSQGLNMWSGRYKQPFQRTIGNLRHLRFECEGAMSRVTTRRLPVRERKRLQHLFVDLTAMVTFIGNLAVGGRTHAPQISVHRAHIPDRYSVVLTSEFGALDFLALQLQTSDDPSAGWSAPADGRSDTQGPFDVVAHPVDAHTLRRPRQGARHHSRRSQGTRAGRLYLRRTKRSGPFQIRRGVQNEQRRPQCAE
jgi:hypothetical protein